MINLILIAMTILPLVSFAQKKPSKLAYIQAKSITMAHELQNKFDDPEEPNLALVADFVVESFAKDHLKIASDAAYACIAREERADDTRYATAYDVLKNGFASECFVKNLTKMNK